AKRPVLSQGRRVLDGERLPAAAVVQRFVRLLENTHDLGSDPAIALRALAGPDALREALALHARRFLEGEVRNAHPAVAVLQVEVAELVSFVAMLHALVVDAELF